MQIPELEPHCGSWICTLEHPDSPPRIAEVSERADAERLAACGWKVQTAAQYLSEYNRAIRFAAERRAALAAFDAEFLAG